MDIRQVGENDWRLVQGVRLRALRENPDVFGASLAREERFAESHWRMRLRTSVTWVSVDDDGVGRGMVTMMQEPGSPVDDRHVVALWVAAESRRHGVGWALLDTVRRAAVAEDARTVSLWLLDSNHAAGDLFVRSGYTRTGERQVVPRDQSQTEERYVLTLRAPSQP
ncbi:GNAT family N-acetyltransferase [Cellulomonas sp. Root137]|uniref:GNAT family N-acetyltransferase n=1 Tax=Cellulomonas sp. Root137 TaxID=1736459 RepID=UPI0006F957A7|nr:GNAT family N-acetyltransferase [Cellulomonas sp. Root137]KQY44167.1 GCN5 family acetyltransferase [Cellulomonas sp. Root137]